MPSNCGSFCSSSGAAVCVECGGTGRGARWHSELCLPHRSRSYVSRHPHRTLLVDSRTSSRDNIAPLDAGATIAQTTASSRRSMKRPAAERARAAAATTTPPNPRPALRPTGGAHHQHTHGRRRQRFLPELKGGDVPRLALSDRRARDLIGRGLPVVLTGGAVLGTDTPAGGWTAEKLLRHLTGTSQVAVVAPACTDRRFTYFNAEAHLGDYGTVPARSVTKQHVKVDATLAQSMQQQQQYDIEETGTASTTSTTTATVPYLQIRVFHAHAGGFGASELPAPLMRELQPSINERPCVTSKRWDALACSSFAVLRGADGRAVAVPL